MFTRKNISLVILFILIALAPALISMTSDVMGTDDKAELVIKDINSGYVRWAEPFWSPSKATETLLFVFQASIGAGFIFFYIMRKRRKR
ncbi:energy-coupling factor ABC transporter substrate-binding protein [Candidatus Magnetominusculus dajiuhuensis]|uniref:energy-coupling factor ABC transporter substrate-binding protein n=1 Tax=Candidatus Magnetominusculus dajiuhuensis TaxID=3137712 RepID=UPI003B43BF06